MNTLVAIFEYQNTKYYLNDFKKNKNKKIFHEYTYNKQK